MEPTSTTLLFHSPKNPPLSIQVRESIHSPPATHLWPSSIVLSRYLFHQLLHNPSTLLTPNTTILELGCGTALPSLLLSKAIPKANKSITIAATDTNQTALKLLPSTLTSFPLKWSATDPPDPSKDLTSIIPRLAIILCADVLYDRDAFDPFLATVAHLLLESKVPKPKCYMAYQNRSSKRCIQHLLDKWGLVARTIALEKVGVVDGRVGPGVEFVDENGTAIGGEGITVEGAEEGCESGSGWGVGIQSVFMGCIQLKDG